MKILELVQGSAEWLSVRLSHFTASEAPAMMGASKYMSRDELLTLKKTGVSKEVTAHQQALFDKGHAAEDAAREIIELDNFIVMPPLVAFLQIDELDLLASLDGYLEHNNEPWEHKLFNQGLADNVRNNVLEPHYYWQLEHQMLVCNATDCSFTCSDGTEENAVHMRYQSVPERREALIAGWKQFAKDLAVHEVKAKTEKVIANEIQALPKLEIALTGNVSASNLAVYKDTALTFIQSVKTDLATDQDFVDAASAIKFFNNGEKELDAVKERALSDTADIKVLFDTLDELKEEMRQKRLTLNKLVKTRKEEIRTEISLKARQDFSQFMLEVSERINGIQINHVVADFDSAMKGKSSIDSLQNAVDTEMSQLKIEVEQSATLIRTNLDSFTELASNHKHLFADTLQLVHKENDDVINLIKARISEYEEQEKIKAEEQRKAIQAEEERKAQAKLAAEQKAIDDEKARLAAEAEASRLAQIQAEEDAKAAELTRITEAEQFKNLITVLMPSGLRNYNSLSEAASAATLAGGSIVDHGNGPEFKLNEVEQTPVNEPKVIQAVSTPGATDIDNFLSALSKEDLNSFGYLLLSNNAQHEAEALNNIKASFTQFLSEQHAA